MVDKQEPGDLEARLQGLESQVAKLSQEVHGLTDEIRRQSGQLKSVTTWHPALLVLVVLTFGFVLALCLMSDVFWAVALGIAAGAGILVYLPFRARKPL